MNIRVTGGTTFAEALADVSGNPIYNRDLHTVLLYTDWFCFDNEILVQYLYFATAGWGVHVHKFNSDQ